MVKSKKLLLLVLIGYSPTNRLEVGALSSKQNNISCLQFCDH